jgi:hypothetical protein
METGETPHLQLPNPIQNLQEIQVVHYVLASRFFVSRLQNDAVMQSCNDLLDQD